jgi:D-xylose transport system substrate-binding protein
MLLPSAGQKRWQAGDGPYFERQAKALGMEPILQNANDDAELQSSQLDTVLTQGVRLIVLAAVNADTAEGMVSRAVAQGVPVIAYNYIIENVELAAIVARDGVDVGRQIGEAALRTSPRGNYVMVFGDQGTSIAVDKARGMMEALQPAIDAGDIRIVSDRYNKDWSPDLAQKQVENALTANKNEIVAVCASNDGMAYGSIEALRAQGLNGRVFVSGEDAEDDALKLIKAGDLTISNFTPFNVMGETAARLAAAVLNGEDLNTSGTYDNGAGEIPWEQIRAFNVDRENLQQFADDNTWWVTPGTV